MRQVTRKGLMTVAAATGVLAATGGYAHADSTAQGTAAGSPGVLSGNSIQVPVHVPVNVCGNSVDVVGLLNPAAGNRCVNTADPHGHGGTGAQHGRPAGGRHAGGAHATGVGHATGTADSVGPGGSQANGHTAGSPGILSGNTVQLPVDIPVNVCGNSVDVIGVANPTAGNDCVNHEGGHHATPPRHSRPTPTPAAPGHPVHPGHPATPARPHTPAPPKTHGVKPGNPPRLAETGTSMPVGTVAPLAAGALLTGGILYRRSRLSA